MNPAMARTLARLCAGPHHNLHPYLRSSHRASTEKIFNINTSPLKKLQQNHFNYKQK
jgi:hypothetical protein